MTPKFNLNVVGLALLAALSIGRPKPLGACVGILAEINSSWGNSNNNSQNLEAEAVATDSYNNLYVANPGTSQILRYLSSGGYISAIGSTGSGNGQFGVNSSPSGVAVDAAGNIYAGDPVNGRVEEFNSSGTFVKQWAGFGTGEISLAVGGGILYIGDYQNTRIIGIHTSVAMANLTITSCGGVESLALDAAGNIYADQLNSNAGGPEVPCCSNDGVFTVLKFTPAGALVGGFSLSSSPALTSLGAIAVDGSGNFYAVDRAQSIVEEWSSSNTKSPSATSTNGFCAGPDAVAVDSAGAIWLASSTTSNSGESNSYGAANEIVKLDCVLNIPAVSEGGNSGGSSTNPAVVHGVFRAGKGERCYVTIGSSSNNNVNVFNSMGVQVRQNLNSVQSSSLIQSNSGGYASTTSSYTYWWDGRDDSGNICPSGVYQILFTASSSNSSYAQAASQASQIAKVVLVR